jgi:hypothetical protein
MLCGGNLQHGGTSRKNFAGAPELQLADAWHKESALPLAHRSCRTLAQQALAEEDDRVVHWLLHRLATKLLADPTLDTHKALWRQTFAQLMYHRRQTSRYEGPCVICGSIACAAPAAVVASSHWLPIQGLETDGKAGNACATCYHRIDKNLFATLPIGTYLDAEGGNASARGVVQRLRDAVKPAIKLLGLQKKALDALISCKAGHVIFGGRATSSAPAASDGHQWLWWTPADYRACLLCIEQISPS